MNVSAESPPALVHRHTLLVRITHWAVALSFFPLLLSGFAILLAHPRLYWGETGYFGEPALLDLPLPVILDQTGWGRSLHFLAAWVLVLSGLVYLATSLLNGHIHRDLFPTRAQMRLRHIAHDVREHLRFRSPQGESTRHYNFLQKTAYLLVILLLFPTLVLSGLTMSPAVAAAHPWLFDLFAGRQSARTVHFICASLLLLFLLVHVGQVFVAGFRNHMLAIITGRMRIPPEST